MKKAHATNHAKTVIPYRRFRAYRYPNAAQPSDYFQKLLDLALTAAIGVGTVTTLLFMFVVF